MSAVDFELNFTDQTMCQTDGVFSEVYEIMSSDFPAKTDWMISTGLTVDSEYGISIFNLHLFFDGRIVIIEYQPSIGDLFYNPDIQAISAWAQQSGWEVPEVHIDLVKSNMEFWRHFWDTLLIDSPYLDSICGERETIREQDQRDMEAEESN